MPTKFIKPRRREGGIPKLNGNTLHREYIFFDTETYVNTDEKGRVEFPLRLGILIYVKIDYKYKVVKRNIYRFYSQQEFINIIKQYVTGRKTIYCFAHNIKFDIMALNVPMVADENGLKSKIPIINDRIFMWRLNHNKAKAVFLDTANYGVISVELLGRDLGYEKLHVDFTKVTDDELAYYCKRDTEILEKFILSYVEFVNANELGSLRLTLASQSLAAWRKRFMRKTVFIHNNETALTLERAAYHGGRSECFRIGRQDKQRYNYFDINSMYPYMMKSSVVPIQLLSTIGEIPLHRLLLYIKAHYVIADVELETDTPAYPLVHDGKLMFPTGHFRTVLHHRELSYAVARNHVVKVHSLTNYQFANIFGHYVDFFYDQKLRAKQTDNKSWYLISKLFMNSLYGKMAQTGVKQMIVEGPYERIIQRYEGHSLVTGDYDSHINWFGTNVYESREGESSYSFPACAGAITANARMYLWDIIECAGRENVYYCDTDSIITNDAGAMRVHDMLNETELGKLKLEKSSPYLNIYGAKDYVLGATQRHKGISPNAKRTDRNKWSMLQFDGILPWFSKGTNVNPTAKYIEKARKKSYNKGFIEPETGIVKPWIMAYDGAALKHSIVGHR